MKPPEPCIKGRCYSPVACNGFGYCRERNHLPPPPPATSDYLNRPLRSLVEVRRDLARDLKKFSRFPGISEETAKQIAALDEFRATKRPAPQPAIAQARS